MNLITAVDWTVIVGGVAAIVWVNWYFFFAERATAVATASADSTDAAIGGGAGDTAPSQVEITVDGGYSPSVRVKSGRPVRLVFDRRDTSSCSEEVVFPDFGIRKFLPSGRRTVVEVTPKNPGTYEFMCGMSMLRGRLIAEE
jgi:plastocyanin domain-containing protein